MSINFPTNLDTLSNPSAGDLLENATTVLDHDQQHSNANDAIEALEAKVGANSSAVTTSHDYKLGEVTGTDKAVGKTATQTMTNKTLTSPAINLSSNATGDIYYRDSGGAFQRLAIGTSTQILQVSTGGIPQWVDNPSGIDLTDKVLVVTVSLNANQIKTMWGTPIDCITAPGAGKIIIVEQCVWQLTAGTAFTAGQQFGLYYDTDNTTNLLASTFATTVVTSATDYTAIRGIASVAVASLGTNKKVQLHSTGGITEFATGTGTAKLFIKYRIITL